MSGESVVKKLYFSLLILLFLFPGQLLAACVSAIAVNDSKTDSWDSTCESTQLTGSYAKYFTFSLSKTQEVTINLSSTTVDTYLFLLNGAGQTGFVIDLNDDIDSFNENSRIVRTLPAGNYTVEATTARAATTGAFIVSVSAATTPADACNNNILTNTEYSGSWALVPACPSTHKPGSYAKYFTFVLTASHTVTIDLSSTKDTYLYLLSGSGQNGAVIEEDDNDGSGTDSRIVRTLLPGSYTVEATTKLPATTGSFTVSVSHAAPPLDNCNNLINTNTRVSGSWSSNCASKNRDGRYAKYYTFSLSSRQAVTVDLESVIDNYLFLLRGEGQNGSVIDRNDDGGNGDNARISVTLEAGTYTVEATTYASGVTGNFFVTVKTAPPSCNDCPFQINAGLNDAWFNPVTGGQGFNITVYPIRKEVFVTWFTFDTERPSEDVTAILGGPGQRWLTAQGSYAEDTAMLTIYLTEGGEFDSATPAASTDQDGYGTMKLEFSGCNEGLVTYEITSLGLSGEIPIQRIVLDNVPLCEVLAEP
jgi:hypothetical protein